MVRALSKTPLIDLSIPPETRGAFRGHITNNTQRIRYFPPDVECMYSECFGACNDMLHGSSTVAKRTCALTNIQARWGSKYENTELFSGGMKFSDGARAVENKMLNAIVEQGDFVAAFTGKEVSILASIQ